MHSTTCSIKFTLSDCFTALHNNCFRLIDWLVAWFFCHAWLLYSCQIIAFFLTAFMMSSWNIYPPKKVVKSGQQWPKVTKKWPKVARSGQKWPKVTRNGQKWPGFSEDSRNQSFQWEKITGECIENAFIAGGIVDKHGSTRCLTQFFVFFRIFLFENGLEWSFWSVDW